VARRALLVLASILASACGHSIPVPDRAPQVETAFTEVPYPPPAVQVETLPARPNGKALWTDGQWLWDGTAWAWTSGGWVVPPPGARLAPWTLRRQADGRLEFAPQTWRDREGRDLGDLPIVSVAIGPGATPAKGSRCAQ
jgi:hypothetical protein